MQTLVRPTHTSILAQLHASLRPPLQLSFHSRMVILLYRTTLVWRVWSFFSTALVVGCILANWAPKEKLGNGRLEVPALPACSMSRYGIPRIQCLTTVSLVVFGKRL